MSQPNNNLPWKVYDFGGTTQMSRIAAFAFVVDAEWFAEAQSSTLQYRGIEIQLGQADRIVKTWIDGKVIE